MLFLYGALQSGGKNQKWPTSGQSGYLTPAVSGIPTAAERGAKSEVVPKRGLGGGRHGPHSAGAKRPLGAVLKGCPYQKKKISSLKDGPALDSHPSVRPRAASDQCFLTAAAAAVPCGVMAALAGPSRRRASVVLTVAGVVLRCVPPGGAELLKGALHPREDPIAHEATRCATAPAPLPLPLPSPPGPARPPV